MNDAERLEEEADGSIALAEAERDRSFEEEADAALAEAERDRSCCTAGWGYNADEEKLGMKFFSCHDDDQVVTFLSSNL